MSVSRYLFNIQAGRIGAAALGWSHGSLAQTTRVAASGTGTLREIIVTVQNRSEDIQNVPDIGPQTRLRRAATPPTLTVPRHCRFIQGS